MLGVRPKMWTISCAWSCVHGKTSRNVSVRRVPHWPCPSISLGASFAGQQLEQGKLQSIGCSGEYNASMQVELGSRWLNDIDPCPALLSHDAPLGFHTRSNCINENYFSGGERYLLRSM